MDGDGIIAIDIDACLDKATHQFIEWPGHTIQPEEIVRKFNSFTYVTLSETGVRVLLRSSAQPTGQKVFPYKHLPQFDKKSQVEIYGNKSFFTISPEQIPGTPDTINERTEEFKAIYETLGGSFEPSPLPVIETSTSVSEEDRQAFAKDMADNLLGGGSRHNTIQAISGALLKCGWGREHIEETIIDVCDHFGDKDPKFEKTKRIQEAIKDIFTETHCMLTRYKKGLPIAGWNSLRENINPEVVARWKNRPGFISWHTAKVTTTTKLPSGFSLREDGLYYQPPESDPLWISAPFQVTAITHNDGTNDHGKQLAWKNVRGKECVWSMPDDLLNDGSALRSTLLLGGISIDPSSARRDSLLRYIMKSKPPTILRSVSTTGWHDGSYVFPDVVIGKTTETIALQTSTPPPHKPTSGSLWDWQASVSLLCRGNSRLIFAVSTAFASIVLSLIGAESFGFHFRGGSSKGKTTALRCAASVFGNPDDFISSWRATSNGLESIAATHNDSLLILDEISQADPKEIGETVYMLANGQGKQRMNRNITARRTAKWKLIFLSSGEKSLRDHMQSAGRQTKAGQEIRCLDIGAIAGPMGVFEDLHTAPSAREFADRLKANSAQYYGIAAREFIEALIEHTQSMGWSGFRQKVEKGIAKFSKPLVPVGADSEVSRACYHFGIVAAVGEIASALNITGWQPNESFDAAKVCFESWLANRGGITSADLTNGIRQVRQFLEKYGSSRFTNVSSTETLLLEARDRAGYRKDSSSTGVTEYFVLPEVFRDEVCSGYDSKLINAELIKQGHIKSDPSDGRQWREKIPGMGRKRFYKVQASIFEE